MTTMTRETLDSLAAIRDSVFGREPTPYDYRDEPWDQTLQQLPLSCLLWQRFKDYDGARRTFESIDETHRRWENERSSINGRLRLANPDTTDAEAFMRDHARGNLIEIALKEQQPAWKERRQRRDQAEEAWQQLWGAYKALYETIGKVKQEPRQMTVPGMVSPRSDKLADLDRERRKFEAPQG